MLGNRKNVFWEALLVAATVFILGLLLGMFFESSLVERMNRHYTDSEISLMDMFALSNAINSEIIGCDYAIQANIDFANIIYNQGLILEEYEKSNQISDEIKLTHKKYDVLRTLLWLNLINIENNCGEKFFTVVYLYEYDSEDLTKRALQNVWSKVLEDLKKERGNEIILLPISGNADLVSLNSLLEKFEVSTLPVVIINNEHIVRELTSVRELDSYFDQSD